MSMFPQSGRRPIELEYGTTDKSIFNFFNAVYAWMAVGLAVTAAVAWMVSQNQALLKVLYGSRGTYAILGLGLFAIAWATQSMAMRISAAAGTAMFLLYAALMGAMLSGIFVVYKMNTIFAAFAMTGGVFGGMSLYGYVTKRDLTSMGSFLIMAALGLFIASLVNIFLASSLMSWVITYAVLAVFIGLTAYDTQKLKMMAAQFEGNREMLSRLSIVGSLNLYVDFINIFLSILRILGSRK